MAWSTAQRASSVVIGVAGVALSGSKISILASLTAGTLFPSRSSQESTVKELVVAL